MAVEVVHRQGAGSLEAAVVAWKMQGENWVVDLGVEEDSQEWLNSVVSYKPGYNKNGHTKSRGRGSLR